MERKKIFPDFLVIPYSLIIDDSLSPLDLKVYGIILWFRNTTKQKKCFTKNSTIALLLSSETRTISSGAIQNSLTRLEKFKYIKRIFQDKYKKLRVEILITNKKKVSSNDDRYHHMMIGVSSYDDSRVSSYDDHSNKNKSNKNIDRESTQVSEKITRKILGWYYQRISKKATSEKMVLTKSVKKVISGALENYSLLDLLLAIQGFSEDTWQMKNNGFRGAEWFFNDSKRLGQYIGLFNENRRASFIIKAKKYLTE